MVLAFLILKPFHCFSYSSILNLHLDPQFAANVRNSFRIAVTYLHRYPCLKLIKCVNVSVFSVRNNFVSIQFKDKPKELKLI